ncbi:MAG TPA: hemerythrin domain-containing protein [Polyangiaceae bacterium]
MKATTLLREQHRRMEGLLTRVTSEHGQARLATMLQLVEELLTHLSLEDHVFLRGVADGTGLRIETYRENHGDVRNALLQAVFAEQDEPLFEERLRELATTVRHHAHVIERDVLGLVDSHVPARELETMGERMRRYWDAAIGGETVHPPPSASHVHAAE